MKCHAASRERCGFDQVSITAMVEACICQFGRNSRYLVLNCHGIEGSGVKPWHTGCSLRKMMSWLTDWRRKRIESEPFEQAHRDVLSAQWSAWDALTPDSRAKLENLVKVFVHNKEFEGCRGLKVTDAMKVLIAAQACMLILNAPGEVFPLCDTVLVYPQKFTRVQKSIGPGGLVTETDVVVSGESWNGLWGGGSGEPSIVSPSKSCSSGA